MKIFVISPNTDKYITSDHLSALRAAGEVTLVNQIRPLEEISELYEGDEPRIVAIDPDFSEWKFPNEVIDKIPNLKAIVLQTTSFSWLDVAHAAEKGIPVVDLRGFSSIAVAEWATFMALSVARRVPLLIKDNWKLDYEAHQGFELCGKVAGVIGLGNIGTAIAENMAGMGMDVQYWSRHSKDARFKSVSLEDVMQTSDVIFVALAINAETRGLVTDGMLNTIKPTSVLVNITEVGAIYNNETLLKLVAGRKIGGYAFEDDKHPFGAFKGNVWNAPALGWCTNESMTKNAEQWVKAMVAATKGEFPTKVN